MSKSIIAITTLLAATALGASSAQTGSIADRYKDRTVTILVGYSAGGTYGQTSLLLSRHIDRKIPGNPSVIVQHMPGAGGIKMTNYAYNAMPKDGYYVMMPPEMILVSQVLRPDAVKYVTDKFTWLGTVFGSNQVLMVRRDTGVKSLEDLRRREIIIASSGTGSPTFLIPKMMNGVAGTKFKIVTGYDGSAKTTLAVEMGEAQGMTNSWVSWQANHARWFKGDDSFGMVFSQVGFTKHPDLPDIPLLTELTKSADDRAAAAMLSTQSVIGRGLAFPPGVPEHLIEPMRTAFWATVSDPDFRAEADKRKLPVIPIKGAELQQTISEAMKMSPESIRKAQAYIFGK